MQQGLNNLKFVISKSFESMISAAMLVASSDDPIAPSWKVRT